MCSKIENHIINYIQFIKKNFGISVTLHQPDKILQAGCLGLFRYDTHINAYCLFVKQDDEMKKRCDINQRLIYRKCKYSESFFGRCHCGVGEFIYAVKSDTDAVGFVCVNGYRDGSVRAYCRIKQAAEIMKIKDSILMDLYEKSLADNLPDKEWLDNIIYPLTDMLSLIYEQTKKTFESKYNDSMNMLNMEIIKYIYKNSSKKICISDLASELNYSKSSISHMFKRSNGVNINEYINKVRVQNSLVLLEKTDMPIQRIGLEVGFSDANYFSKKFKEIYKVSPTEWRNTFRLDSED